MSLTESHSWQRWSVTMLGVLLGTATTIHAFVDRDTLFGFVQELVLPFAIAGSLVVLGTRLARSDLESEHFRRLLTWVGVASAAFGFLGSWLFVHRVFMEGMEVSEGIHELTTMFGAGALAGVGIGIYDVRRQQREAELELTNTAIETTMDGIAVLDSDDRYVSVNRSYADIHGYDTSEPLVGERWCFLSSEENRERFAEEIRPHLAETGAWRGEAPVRRSDGTRFAEELTITELEDGGRVCVVRDITGRKERERELQSRITAMDASMDGIAILDEDGVYTYVNEAHTSVYGYDDPDTFIGETWQMCYTDEAAAYFEEQIMPVLWTDGQWRGEAMGKRKDGSLFPQELTLTVLEDGGLVCVVRDVADRKERERELEVSEARFRSLTENTQFSVVTIDEESTVRFANDAIEDTFGYEPDEVVGERLTKLMPDRFEDPHLEGIERYLREGTKRLDWEWIELAGLHEDGHEFPIGVSFGTYAVDGDRLFTGVIHDITERKEQEDNLRALHGVTREFLAATTAEAITTRMASVADDMLGYPLTAVWEYDTDADRLVPLLATEPARRFAAQAGLDDLPALESASAEMEIFEDGEPVLVDEYDTLDDRQVTGVPLGAVLFVPLGDHGLVAIGSPESGAIDATDRLLGEILVSNASAAIDRLEREQTIERSEALLDQTQRMADVGGWEYDVRTGEVQWTDEVYRIYDLPLDAELGLEKVLGFFHSEDVPALEEAIERAIERDESYDLELRVITANDDLRWVNARGTPYQRGDETVLLRGAVQDITERKKREQTLRTLHDATREMMAAETRREVATIASETAIDVLDFSLNALYRHETDAGLVPVAVSQEAQDVVGESPRIAPGEGIAWQVFETDEAQVYSDVREAPNVLNPETPIRTELALPLGDYGVFILGSTTVDDFDETDVALARVLAANVEVALEQVERERELETLHDATREMLRADTQQEVCDLAAEASKDVLSYPVTVVRLLDDEGETLTPIAQTAETRERVGDRPAYPVSGTPAGRAFQQGTVLVYDDLDDLDSEDTHERYDRGAARAAMYVPLGDHGVISIADTNPGVFDQSNVHLANLLAANTEAALDRVGREVQLRAQREDLARQNDRLEEFASVVSHDLRNPLTIAMGYLDLIETEDEQPLEKIRNAHDRMEQIIEDVLALARQGKSVGETRPVSVTSVAETAWSHVETHDARLVIEDEPGTVSADEGRLEALFENLFRNATEHVGQDVTVRVGPTPEGFYVEDDGPGIPADAREQVFEHGHTTSESGTGFGLSIVKSIAEAHGWEVALADAEAGAGGARFEVRCYRTPNRTLTAHQG